MTNIVEFLTARYDEEQQLAEAVAHGPWHVELLGDKGYPQRISNAAATVIAETWTGPEWPPLEAEHIARHDPARALADIEAKRRIMARHVPIKHHQYALVADACAGCGQDLRDGSYLNNIDECPNLRDLAAVYADHPDYNEAWRTDD